MNLAQARALASLLEQAQPPDVARLAPPPRVWSRLEPVATTNDWSVSLWNAASLLDHYPSALFIAEDGRLYIWDVAEDRPLFVTRLVWESRQGRPHDRYLTAHTE